MRIDPKEGSPATPDLLHLSGTVGLSDIRASPPGQPYLTVEAKSIELTIGDELLRLAPDHPERSRVTDFRREIGVARGSRRR